ncbi:MAG: STAS domain-containing protein [Verrucomicrobiota bacterium]
MADEFQTNIVGDALHIAVSLARLDAGSSALIKAHLQDRIDPDVRRAEVDLGSVQFIDSSGVGFLLGIYRKLPNDGAEVILRNVQPPVQAVLELLRLHRVFKLA